MGGRYEGTYYKGLQILIGLLFASAMLTVGEFINN